MVTILRRIAAVVMGLAGLVFLLIGTVQLRERTWDGVTGTVQSCTAPGAAGARGRNVQSCVVTWNADGTDRAHTLALPLRLAVPGCPVDLRVKGDRAALATPLWQTVAPAAVGAALVVTAGVLFVRARRKGTFRAKIGIV